MSGRRFDREIGRLALPALGALASDPLTSLVDTAFVGRVGTEELGALGVATAIFGVLFFTSNFLAYGTTPLVAGSIGRGDRDEAGRTVIVALIVAAVAGVVALVALEAAVVPLVAAMGAEPGVAESAQTYLRIRALALPAVMIVLAGHGAFRGYQDTATPFVVAVGLNAVNLVLDPILIFGAGWGIAGAAWATVAAQWLGGGAFLWLLLRRRRTQLGITLTWPDWGRVRVFLTAGRDLVLRTAALVGAFTLATAVAARMGALTVAAHQVAGQLLLFLALSVDALAIAAQAMVGRHLGQRDPVTARQVSLRLLVWGGGVGVLLMGLMAAAAPVLPNWFSDDPEVVGAVRGVYFFVVLIQPLNALVFVWDGIVIGATDFRFLAFSTGSAAVAGAVVMLLALGLDLGLAGVWWGIVTLMVVRASTMVWWQWRGSALRVAAAG